MDFRAVQFHRGDVGLLAANVNLAHVNRAIQAKLCARGGGGQTVLARAGLGDDSFFAHALCKQALADGVVDFMGACVGQTFKLYVDLRSAQNLCGCWSEVKRRFAANVVAPDYVQLVQKIFVGHGLIKSNLQFVKRAAQNFRHILSAVLFKKSVC